MGAKDRRRYAARRRTAIAALRLLESFSATCLLLHVELTFYAEVNDVHDIVVRPWIGYPLLFGVLWACFHVLLDPLWKERP